MNSRPTKNNRNNSLTIRDYNVSNSNNGNYSDSTLIIIMIIISNNYNNE